MVRYVFRQDTPSQYSYVKHVGVDIPEILESLKRVRDGAIILSNSTIKTPGKGRGYDRMLSVPTVKDGKRNSWNITCYNIADLNQNGFIKGWFKNRDGKKFPVIFTPFDGGCYLDFKILE
jgi:hypothetical protein